MQKAGDALYWRALYLDLEQKMAAEKAPDSPPAAQPESPHQ